MYCVWCAVGSAASARSAGRKKTRVTRDMRHFPELLTFCDLDVYFFALRIGKPLTSTCSQLHGLQPTRSSLRKESIACSKAVNLVIQFV